jgi:hypothetical protein
MEYVCDELEELERKADKEGKLSMSEIEYADVLAHLKKDILTADAMMEESEYSERGGIPYRGGRTMRGSSYARGRGDNARRDSRGRYSSEGGSYAETADEISEKLEELMRQAPDEKSRMEIQRFMTKLDQM